jgi:AcrR family transcriptional regulator
MIADAIGVTKAAVYHQFRTKEEIVIALTSWERARLQEALQAAEAELSRVRARELFADPGDRVGRRTPAGGQHVAVRSGHRRTARRTSTVSAFVNRLYGVLISDDDEAPVPAAMLAGAIGVAVTHPLVADVDDDTLRVQLLQWTQRLVELPG